MITLALTPDAGDCRDRYGSQREAMLRLRVLLACELEERTRRDDAAITLVEATAFGAEIKYRTASAGWRNILFGSLILGLLLLSGREAVRR